MGFGDLVGTGRFELPTCRLGGDRSIHLSYVPASDSSLATALQKKKRGSHDEEPREESRVLDGED